MTRKMNDLRCKHVRGSHVVPGWGCCTCSTYNGYQRSNCNRCGHVPCFELKSEEGREALELRPIGHDPNLVREWMIRQSARHLLGQLVGASSGLSFVMLRAEGIRELQEVLNGWGALAGVVAQLEADRQARIEKQSKKSSAKQRRSTGKRRRVS